MISGKLISKLWRLVYKIWPRLFPDDGFLKKVSGVIHVGAHLGQERGHYASRGLNVIWIEPNPKIFEALQNNISAFPKQIAYCRLLADKEGAVYDFHVSSNVGASSSIFALAAHTDVWPGISYTHDIRLTATTLASLVNAEDIDLGKYGALVLDTQGSELLVLRGAANILDRFRFIKAEVADFEIYTGCCQLRDVTAFLSEHRFVVHRKTPFARRDAGGTCYDVVYRRI